MLEKFRGFLFCFRLFPETNDVAEMQHPLLALVEPRRRAARKSFSGNEIRPFASVGNRPIPTASGLLPFIQTMYYFVRFEI
jgi:hypothetical protein